MPAGEHPLLSDKRISSCRSATESAADFQTRLDDAQFSKWRRGILGQLLVPGSDDYERARPVFNAAIDRRPALIVRCLGVQDIIRCLELARNRGLPLAIRAGGHSAAGFGVADGGIVIDLSRMKGIRVEPARKTVRVEPGVLWREFDHETMGFGLATTGARISSVGVAGATLGGGYGWLMRKHGLSIDNLLSVDLVTAEGKLLTVSEDENPDLFWGLRGGGGNFGVVTSLKFRLHELPAEITGGMAFYPPECARELLIWYREVQSAAPDELSMLCNFLSLPPVPFVPAHLQGTPAMAIAVCHCGFPAQARHDLAPLRSFGAPLIDRIGAMPYTRLQRMFDAAGASGYRTFGRSGHLSQLSDGAIDVLAWHGTRPISPLSIVMVSPLGGAVARVAADATAFSHRQAPFDFAINSVWSNASESHRQTNWTNELWQRLLPYSKGVYVNELGNEGHERVRAAYSAAAYRRLAELKAKFDPENIFRLNHNIPPLALRETS